MSATSMEPAYRGHARALYRSVACTVIACALAACDSPEHISGTHVALAPASTPSARLSAFVAAQGTYCNDAVGLICADNAFYGLGYVYGFCTINCTTAITADFGGVNRKWWDARNLGAFPGAYSSTGTVKESVRPDGRRRLIVDMRAENTFVAFYDATNTPIVGADFFEYETIGDPSYRPLTGSATLHADLILPLGYVGYPDIIEAAADPTSGITVNAINTTAQVDGVLRIDHDGLAAGTMVRVQGTSRSLLKLATRGVPSRRLMALGYDATSRIEVRALR